MCSPLIAPSGSAPFGAAPGVAHHGPSDHGPGEYLKSEKKTWMPSICELLTVISTHSQKFFYIYSRGIKCLSELNNSRAISCLSIAADEVILISNLTP